MPLTKDALTRFLAIDNCLQRGSKGYSNNGYGVSGYATHPFLRGCNPYEMNGWKKVSARL